MIRGINVGDFVMYKSYTENRTDYFYIHNIVGGKIIASGVSTNGFVYAKNDCYVFSRKANAHEECEFHRLIRHYGLRFDTNLGVQ